MSFTNNPVNPEDIPRYENIELTPLPDAAMWVAVISWLIFFVIAAAVTVVGRLLSVPLFVDFLAYWVVAVIVFVGLMMLWTAYSYRFKGYAMREHDLLFQRGVIWRKRTILPFNRVQHVETHQGVLQRKFKLTTLKVFTAGGQRADLDIPGMDVAITEGIKETLLSRIQAEELTDD